LIRDILLLLCLKKEAKVDKDYFEVNQK